MAKAKKRVAARKNAVKRATPKKAKSKSQRASTSTTKTPSKKVANRATPKKTKSKVQPAATSAKTPATKKKRTSKTAARKAPKTVAEVLVETTVLDVIEEPSPGVFVVSEYEFVQTKPTNSPGGEPEGDEGPVPEK
jgi:hypothetical protein